MKDPAFLFYSSDFLSGTMLMTDEQVGRYIKLMCLQHQKGHLPEKDMTNICKGYDEDIFSKFIKDENNLYYNQRLEEEMIKRNSHKEKQRENINKRWLKDTKPIPNEYQNDTKDIPLENVNENVNVLNEKEKGAGKGENKIHFAEFVTMTNDEYEKLVVAHGKELADQCINVLDNYKGSSGKKYKSDYRAILSWVIDRVNEKKVNPKQQGKPTNAYHNPSQTEYNDLDRFYT